VIDQKHKRELREKHEVLDAKIARVEEQHKESKKTREQAGLCFTIFF